jgi:hypothetical protein
MFRGRVQEYWLPTPFACFPFTSPPVRRLVISRLKRAIPPFNGNKQKVPAFIGNVDIAFAVINPSQKAVLYKIVLTRTSGEPRPAISHGSLKNWAQLRVSAKRLHRETNPRLPCESTL